MSRVGLYGAAALVLATAAAAEPARLDGGGELFLGAGLFPDAGDPVDAAGHGRRDIALQQTLFLHGSVERDFGTGLTLGAYASVRVDELRRGAFPTEPDAADPVRSAVLRLKTESAGEFQLGHTADARVQLGLWAPQVCACFDGMFGTNTPVLGFDANPTGVNSTTVNLDERAAKLLWYGPDWDGFGIALSYAPEQVGGYPIDPRDGLPGRPREAALRQFWSGSAGWQHVWGGTTLALQAGLTRAERRGGGDVSVGRNDGDPLVWDAGFTLSYAAWKVGFAVEQQQNINAAGFYGAAAYVPNGAGGFLAPRSNGLVNRTFDLGFTYDLGPLTGGIAWSRGLYEGVSDPEDAKRVAIADSVFAGLRWGFRTHLDAIGGVVWTRYAPSGGAVAGSVPSYWLRSASAAGPVVGLQARF